MQTHFKSSRIWAAIITVALILLSMAGFWKGLQGKLLFGSLKLSFTASCLHGLFALFCFFSLFLSEKYFHLIFQIVGVLFAAWAGFEFLLNEDFAGINAKNFTLAWIHVAFSVAALIEGFNRKS